MPPNIATFEDAVNAGSCRVLLQQGGVCLIVAGYSREIYCAARLNDSVDSPGWYRGFGEALAAYVALVAVEASRAAA